MSLYRKVRSDCGAMRRKLDVPFWIVESVPIVRLGLIVVGIVVLGLVCGVELR